MILTVIRHYYPWFDEPRWDTWCKTLCPFHGESNPSASINIELDRFNCHACGVGGDAIDIIRHEEEGISFAAAKQRLEEILVGSGITVQPVAKRKRSRRVFGE